MHKTLFVDLLATANGLNIHDEVTHVIIQETGETPFTRNYKAIYDQYAGNKKFKDATGYHWVQHEENIIVPFPLLELGMRVQALENAAGLGLATAAPKTKTRSRSRSK